MRASALVTIVAIAGLWPDDGAAQERATRRAPLSLAVPVVSVAPALADVESDKPTVAMKRLSDEWSARLRPIEERFREDRRLRRAGVVVGLGTAALGALRGQRTLTFVGTQALRLGLDKHLTLLRERSGFVLEPTIGPRAFAITASRTFPK
jgi:hypothetical protein